MLTAFHPLPKLAVCLVWIAASVLVFDAGFQLAVIALVAFLLVAVERRSPLLVIVLMLPFALFGAGFLTTSVMFGEESAYAERMAGEALFASSAVAPGIVLFLRAVACGMVSALFALTTDPAGLVKALMLHVRLSPRIAHALFAAMLLVPDLAAQAQQIRLARAMRTGRPPRRIPGPVETASLVVPLLAFAIRRAGRAAIAMETRGLTGGRPRTVVGAPRLRRRDGLCGAAAILLLAAVLALA
ncbi:MAG: cobalt transporter [Ahrensia sp.]|nr:cobalt transporter [Ahrensia sp.]